MKNNKDKKMFNQHKAFKYSLIASAVLGLSSVSAFAEEASEKENKAEKEVEVIEVTGVRGDLFNAQNMKREGDTFLDAISAADIGSLPDRSVLEAISRLPGVALERFAGANDPDHFGVEGSGVVIRGLTHVRSEFNGRDSFSADSGRGLSFQDISPELMGSVEVFKNQTADMIEGGIAGTVNLITRKPFDADGRVFSFSLDATYGDFIEETTPTFSALYSDVFETSVGRFGFLVNYSSSELKAQSDGTQVGRFWEQERLVDGQNVWVPETIRLTRKQDDRKRQGAALSLQWESLDKTIVATGEYLRSDSSLAWNERAVEGSKDDNFISQTDTEFEFDDQGLFEKGIITGTSGWRGPPISWGDDPLQWDKWHEPGVPLGPQHTMLSRSRSNESLVEDYSFNIKFTPNDTWSFNFDVQYVKAEMDVLDFSAGLATRSVVGLDRTGNDIPKVDLYDADYSGNSAQFTDPDEYFWRYAMDHIQENEGEEFATQFDVEYTLDQGFISSIELGARYAKRDQTTRQSDYNWEALSETWAGDGSLAWASGEDAPYEEVSFNNFARGGVLNTTGGNSFLFPALSIVNNYGGAYDILSQINAGNGNSWKPLANREGATGNFLDNEINETLETSTAFYLKANFEGEVGGMDYAGNIGVRYVSLENETKGFITYPDDIADPDSPLADEHFLPDDQKAFGDAASEAQTAKSDYDILLPSFNVKLNISDELLLRFAFSQGISLPDLGSLRNYVSISGEDKVTVEDPDLPEGAPPIPLEVYYDRYAAKSGNPYLKPMESYNYDLSLEWYFADVGSLTTSLFYKDLSNYFINGVSVRDYTNNGSTQQVEVGGATNGDEGTIRGIEFAYTQFFDFLPGAWAGLGMQFNYTYIDEEGSPNSGLSPDKPDSTEGESIMFEGLPLEGLSQDNMNIVAMYEKYDINARIAYNWRSSYLLTSRDVITEAPIYNEDMGQLDASIFYDINDNWKVGLQGTNLTNAVTKTSMQIDEEGTRVGRAWFVNDRRYSIIVRATF
ncbi:MAG: TonB-dependent receptor [Colwellia sp.]|nr:TonB-dependent receptor [Colwellia sp.]